MSIILARDDLIPLMESYGMTAIIADLAEQNATSGKAMQVLEWELSKAGIFLSDITESRLEHLVADLILAGKLTGAEIWLGSNVEGVARAAAPTGIGISSENVWANAPGATYTFRFYVNGELKLTLQDYYITSLASIEATSGDTVQICQVVDDLVGWWASIAVP